MKSQKRKSMNCEEVPVKGYREGVLDLAKKLEGLIEREICPLVDNDHEAADAIHVVNELWEPYR